MKQRTLPDKGRFARIALIAGSLGLLASAVGYFADREQFYFSYLTAFVFWVSIGLGGLFLTLLHHVVGAKWSVVLRRFSEAAMAALPFMVFLLLPLLFGGMHVLYHWTHAEVVAGDALLQGKSPYLNSTFFVVRGIGYFVIWFLLARFFHGRSLRQDETFRPGEATRLRQWSAPSMLLFGFSLTFAAFDWVMSLDAHWYSTIFGVYFFAGSVIGVLAFLILVLLFLRRRGVLHDVISIEHYHDLGKLLFAFTVFWAYIAFSQYMLIWYGNIPEETVWFAHRWEGTWKIVSLKVVIGHFVIPFFMLIPRFAKRNLKVLSFMAFWMLLMHWIDLYWLVMPNLHHHGVHLSWIDGATMVGMGGIFIGCFWKMLNKGGLLPVHDPDLAASMRFINH